MQDRFIGFNAEPLFSYTTIPLNTATCAVYDDTCQAMNAVADSLESSSVHHQNTLTCQLSMDCLILRCNGSTLTVSLTLFPCDYSVKLKFLHDGGIDYERRFVLSDVETLYVNGTSEVKIDVTVARFTDGSSLGLQVCR